MTMHVTAVENYKGGVGKTTTASNLAYELSCAGYRTLLVDMDPQQNAAYLLRAKPRKVNLEDAIRMKASVKKAIQRCVFSKNLYFNDIKLVSLLKKRRTRHEKAFFFDLYLYFVFISCEVARE